MSQLTAQITTTDRLGLTLIFALIVHAIIIFGIAFGVDEDVFDSKVPPTLDVTLVNTRSESKPEHVDYLAQTNQEGAGNTQEKIHPETLTPALIPKDSAEITSKSPPIITPAPKQKMTRREILTQTESESHVVADVFPAKETESEKVSAAQLISRSLDIASLEVELGESMQAYSELPRQKFVTASTQEYVFASYVDSWRRKIERVGNLNFPEEASRRKISGSLILDVALNVDGTISKIRVSRSSGHKMLDNAAIKIVRLAAPFAPFPKEIRKDYDVLHVIRTWKFLGGERFTTSN